MIRYIRKFGGELTVAFGRVASIAMGPLVALAIASRLTPDEQGYYFAFVSILGARVAFDAGLAQVLVNTTAQTASLLSMDRAGHIDGSAEALANVGVILRFALRWYMWAGAAMLTVVGIGGYVFFLLNGSTHIDWQWPWVWFILLGAIDFIFQCLWTVLEGLNQIIYVYLLRTIKTLAASVTLVMIVVLHGGLWACVGYAAVLAVSNLYLVYHRFGLLKRLLTVTGGRLRWQTEIWPFQWRMALSWAGGYLIVPLFVPIAFSLVGPAAAGQVGMTMTILTACISLAQSVIDAKIPFICGLVAEHRWTALDLLFFRRVALSLGLLLAIFGGAILAIHVFDFLGWRFSQRITSWPIFYIFAVSFGINHLVNSEASYLRSHRREPFLWLSITTGILMVCTSIMATKWFGVSGLGIGYLSVSAVYSFPVATAIFLYARKKWHD